MKMSWQGLFLLVSSYSIHGMAQTQPDPRGNIQGMVLDPETGKPLAGATVDLTTSYHVYGRPTAASTTTNAQGVFTFRVQPNEYHLTAAKRGYLSDDSKPEKYLSLEAGDTRTGFVFRLLREGVVRGRLTDADGDLVGGTMVSAWQWRFAGGQRYLAECGTVRPWPDGSFRIGGLRPGWVYLSAKRFWEYADYGGRPRMDSSASTFYRDSVDAASAEPIRVAPGTEIDGIELRMGRTTVYRVQGAVTGPPGMKPTALSLCAEWLPKFCLGTLMRADGKFTIENVPKGQFEIRGEAFTPAPQLQRLIAGQSVAVDDHLGDVLVAYSPAPEVRSTIQGGRGTFQLLSVPENSYVGNLGELNDGLSPRILPASPGLYRAGAVDLPESMYVDSIRSGDRDVTSGFQLTSAGLPLDIVLAPGAARVSGTVRDGQGNLLTEVAVTIWNRADGARALARTASTDQDGKYEFSHLPPGEYRIAAWQGIWEGMAQYREFFEAFGSEAKAIQLVGGSSEQVELVAIDERVAAVQAAKVR